LAVLLLSVSISDILVRRIPNRFCVFGVLAGLGGHVWAAGLPGLADSLLGIAAALPLLLLYAVRAFGAGDVKLLMAVGALMGPGFLLWTLCGAVFAAALLALAVILRRGRSTLLPPLAKATRLPFAPAVAAGAVFAFIHLHLL